MLRKNAVYDITIRDLTAEGLGVGEAEGIAVFVPDMLIGEKGEVRIIKTAKNYAVGKLEALKMQSENRISPSCPVFSQCGGCTILHLSYPAQLEVKRNRVANCLERIAKVKIDVPPVLPSKQELHYRNKTAFPLQGDGEVKIGCYKTRSHDIVDTKSCLLQSKEADRVLTVIRDWIQKYHISIYKEGTQKGLLRHMY